MVPQQRTRAPRVGFDMGYPARITAIDGTWCRNCYLENVSQTGAKITINGSIEGLNLSEFFLVLSSTGNAHRRCRMIWVKGDAVGVRFETKPISDRPRSHRS